MSDDNGDPPASPASPMPAGSLVESTLDDSLDEGLRAVIVAAYNSPIEAEMAKSRLMTEGIDSELLDIHTASIGTHMTLAIGGVKVRVLEEDAERAHEVLTTLGDFVLPGDDEEDEDDALVPTEEKPDLQAMVSRALASGVISAIFFPPLSLYSLWLLLRALREAEPLGPKGRAKAWGALAFDVVGLVWLMVLLRL